MNRLKYVVLILPLKYEMMIWVLMQLRAQGIEWPSWYFPFFLHLTLQYIKSIDLPDLKINIVINKDIFGSPVSGEWGGVILTNQLKTNEIVFNKTFILYLVMHLKENKHNVYICIHKLIIMSYWNQPWRLSEKYSRRYQRVRHHTLNCQNCNLYFYNNLFPYLT